MLSLWKGVALKLKNLQTKFHFLKQDFLFNDEMQPAYQIINCTFLNFLTNDFNILLFMVELNEADADWNIVTVTGTQRSDTKLRAFLNIYEAFRARV